MPRVPYGVTALSSLSNLHAISTLSEQQGGQRGGRSNQAWVKCEGGLAGELDLSNTGAKRVETELKILTMVTTVLAVDHVWSMIGGLANV